MSEINKYVDDTILSYYDGEIKTWFEEKVNEVPMMGVIYDEENENGRVIEFVDVGNSSSDGEAKIETCAVTFPSIELGLGEVYYLDGLGTMCVLEMGNLSSPVTIRCMKPSIIVSTDLNLFESTYVSLNSNAQAIGAPTRKNALIVIGDTVLGYADNAPV